MITVSNLTVSLNGRTILDNICIEIAKDEKLAISGESGSGKSTLLKTLLGGHRPQHGRIDIDGKELNAANVSVIRSLLYYLPQDVQPLGDETVAEFLSAPFRLAVNDHRRFDRNGAAQWFERLALKSHLMESTVSHLSGGERKRLGLVQALLLARPILILDELTSSVDEANSTLLVDTVLGLTDTTVVAVTHDAQLMERATRHVVLRDGRFEGALHGDGHGRG